MKINRAQLVLLLLLALVGCQRPGNSESRAMGDQALIPVRVAVGGQSLLIHSVTTLAAELGYFRREGLDVQLQDTPGSSKAMQALLGGSAEVGSIFYDQVIQMAAQGQEVSSFVTMLQYPGFAVVVSPQSKKTIRRIEDLRGVVIGVTAPGSSSHLLINFLLRKYGLSPADVSINGMGAAASMVAALERGRVDAASVYEPVIAHLQTRNPNLVILADTRTADGVKQVFGADIYPATVLCATRRWIDRNPETVRRLARATRKASNWMHEHSAEQVMDKMPASFRGDDPAAYLHAVRDTIPMLSTDGLMTPAGAEAVKRFVAVSLDSHQAAELNVARTYTNEYLLQGQK